MQNKLKRLTGLPAALLLLSVLSITPKVWAQNAGTIRGTVTDASASVMPNVRVQITGGGTTRTANTDATGKFTLTLPPGSYAVKADAKGFVTFSQTQLAVTAGQATPLDITLQIQAEAQEVNVSDSAAGQVSVDPSSNVGALVLKNEDLDALPDDPDDLQADLTALAGPSAGPNGAQFFIDGFSGGQLPPKSSIREIRINSNPFSAEFDAPGFGRIEIFTKPGTDKYHGSASINYGDKVLDTRNPFIAVEPGYSTKSLMANFGGPINKKSSFQFNMNRRQIDEDNLIKAVVLGPGPLFQEQSYIGAYPTPNRLLQLTGRLDYAINATNTLVMRYTHTQSSNVGGVGGLNLPSQQTTGTQKINEIQITETSIIGTKAVDETRFQFRDSHNATSPTASAGPGINVGGSFNSGGPPQTQPDYTFNRGWELSNFITISQGAHAIKIGGRARDSSITDFSTSNFNGSYSFSLPAGVIPACLAALATGGYQPTSLDLYQQTQIELSQGIPIATIEAQGCGPTQFTLASGLPLVNVRQQDLGMFVQDDWRAKPNLTISLGIRYETQNNIHDHDDWAPRFSFAWAPFAKKNAPSKTVIRSGYGWFYSRIPIGDAESALRNNGFTQQNYQLNSTSAPLSFYPGLPSAAALGGATLLQQNIDIIDKTIKAPLLMQTAIGIERSLPGRTTVAFNYIDSRGIHVARQRDINAPLTGPYAAGIIQLPYAGFGPIYNYETSGLFKQSQYTTSANTRFNRRFSLNGYYVLGFAHTNASGLPMNQYNDDADWGRASYDHRHTGYIGGNITLPYAITAAPFITMNTGGPFNITTGGYYDGDGIANLRPAFATAPGANSKVIATKYGTFDLNPTPGEQIIPINYGQGPGSISANVRISRTWGWGEKVAPNPNAAGGPDGGPGPGGAGGRGPGFGVATGGGGGGGGRGGGGAPGGGGRGGGGGGGGAPRGPSSGKKYSLTATVNARNFINHVNLGAPTGLVSSPFFGQSTALGGGGGGGFGGGGSAAGVRRIEFSLRLAF